MECVVRAAVWALGSEHLGNTGPWSVDTVTLLQQWYRIQRIVD